MSRRLQLSVLLLVFVALIAGLTVRWTGGSAVVLARDGHVRLVAGPLVFAPRWRDRLGSATRTQDGALLVEGPLSWQGADGSPHAGRLRLVGTPPTGAVPWLDRDAGLAASLERHAAAMLAKAPGTAAGERALRDELVAQGWQLQELTAEAAGGEVAPPPVVPELARFPKSPPLLVLGLDALDESLVDPMIARGELPTLARLADPSAAARGIIHPFDPLLSPLLWTTMATGAGPEEHGILDFLQATGESRNGQPVVTPVMSTSRRLPALWNIASAAGRRSAVIGWWATFPAEAVRGVVVSDRASAQLFIRGRGNLRDPGTIYPEERAGELERSLVLDTGISDAEVARFVHLGASDIAARRAGNDQRDPVVQLVRLLASTRSYVAMADDLWQADRPDLMLLYLEGTDTIGHLFGPYHPPRLPWISQDDYDRYHDAVATYYRDLDARLAPLVERALSDGATVMVLSDHGFEWGNDRPRAAADTRAATAAIWHRDRAVFWARGPAARPGGQGTGTMFDIAPTILAMLDLPAGRAMRGKPLDWALAGAAPSTRFAYHSQLPPVGPTAFDREGAAPGADAAVTEETLARLQALGYLGGGEHNPAVAKQSGGPGGVNALATRNSQLNLGTVLLDKGDAEGALRAFRTAVEADPGDAGGYNKEALALEKLSRYDEAIAAYREAIAHARIPEQIEAAWLGTGLAEHELGRPAEARDAFLAGTRAVPGSFPLLSNLAQAEHALGNETGALAALQAAMAVRPNDLETINLTAALQAKLGRTDIARRLWQQSLSLEPDQPKIREFLRLLAEAER